MGVLFVKGLFLCRVILDSTHMLTEGNPNLATPNPRIFSGSRFRIVMKRAVKYSFLHSQQLLYFRDLKTIYLLILLTIWHSHASRKGRSLAL